MDRSRFDPSILPENSETTDNTNLVSDAPNNQIIKDNDIEGICNNDIVNNSTDSITADVNNSDDDIYENYDNENYPNNVNINSTNIENSTSNKTSK